MENSLRILLLCVGVVIILGIIWDLRRDRTKKRKLEKVERSGWGIFGTRDFDEHEEHFDELDIVFDEAGSMDKTRIVEPQYSSKMPEIISLYVMSKGDSIFTGEKLIEAFSEVNLYYGDMQIFHRHEERDGSGDSVFSVVSSVEPGFFELSKIDKVMTPGITLFFEVTQPNQSIAAFELMLRTAKQLAQRLNGELKDDRRRPLTIQSIEKYRERIRNKASSYPSLRAS